MGFPRLALVVDYGLLAGLCQGLFPTQDITDEKADGPNGVG